MDEAELISAAAGGDRRAFDELVRRTYVDTYTLACRLTGNEEDARDVVQEAYLRAWRGHREVPGRRGRSPRGCTASPRTRAATQRQAAPPPAGRAASTTTSSRPTSAPSCQPAAMAESAEALERIAGALDELPPKLRSVVVLKDVYDLSHEAIADELGISVVGREGAAAPGAAQAARRAVRRRRPRLDAV